MSNALEVLRDYLQSPTPDKLAQLDVAWSRLHFCAYQLQEQVDDGLQAAKEREELRAECELLRRDADRAYFAGATHAVPEREELKRRLEEREKTILYALQELREERDAAEQKAAKYVQALGLLSTLAPEVQVDVENPVDKAKAIERSVNARLKTPLDKAKTERELDYVQDARARLASQVNALKKANADFRKERKDLRRGLAAMLSALEQVANHVGHHGIALTDALIDDPAKMARTIVAEFDSRIRSRDAKLASSEYARHDALREADILRRSRGLLAAEVVELQAELRAQRRGPKDDEEEQA